MINNLNRNSFFSHKRDRASLFALLVLFLLSFNAKAQGGGGQGNTTIFGGAQKTIFGNYDFSTGGGGVQPGMILTERAANNFGILNFVGNNLAVIGASEVVGALGYVDGYVGKYGTGQFIFPVGDNSKLGEFAASADGTMGAYFYANPATAVTSNLFTGGNYPALPTGGPFSTTTKDADIATVSTVEYWDIDGANATPITLTWDAESGIAALTTSKIVSLTIVGWDGAQWVRIPSKFDVTSILGGTSDLTAGSITTTGTVVPDTYTAYTLASVLDPLPVTLVSFTAAKEGNTANLKWATTEETNSDYFQIQHSVTGKEWADVDRVASNGESKTIKNYTFNHKNPVNGENLYRLKMVDKDQTFAYSRMQSLTFEGLSEADLSVYPNPVADKLFLRDFKDITNLQIYNVSGQAVYKTNASTNGEVNVSDLNAGMYIVKISRANGHESSQKIIVRK